jgi:predicted alpha/beta-hydrolase family hydrolase
MNGIVLTHGAGSNADAPLLVALAAAFEAAGWRAVRYNLPYRQLRPKGPPFPAQAAADRAGLAEAVAQMRASVDGVVAVGGHSYGGRQASMLAAEQPGLIDALLLLSYPLHPPKKPEQLRTAHFADWRTPGLFVHGMRDPFATSEELRESTSRIPAAIRIMSLERAGHDLKGVNVSAVVAEFQRMIPGSCDVIS